MNPPTTPTAPPDRDGDGARDVPIVPEYGRTGATETPLTARLDRGSYLLTVDYTSPTTDPGAEPVEVDYVVELAEPASTRAA